MMKSHPEPKGDTCSGCGEQHRRMLHIRAQWVGVEPGEVPEQSMCLSCAIGWPGAIKEWWAAPDGTITIRHAAVIGEWAERVPALD